MTITFFSNALNDHQLPFCHRMCELAGENNFRFVASEPISEERASYGFVNMNDIYPFVIKSYESPEAYNEALKLMNDSDVVIVGSEKHIHLQERILQGKLTFRYSETIFKQLYRRFDPRIYKQVYNRWLRFRNYPVYTLCASSFLADELSLCGYPKTKCLKWGYFPEVKTYRDEETMDFMRIKETVSSGSPIILWVGRMIAWKHPEVAVKIASRLKSEGYNFKLRMIGKGTEETKIREMIDSSGLEDCVEMIGGKTPEEVRQEMEKASVFLFTSDRNEGWGVVLNESMNSGCAVVASRSAGSTRFLINHKKNGFIYEKPEEAYQYVKVLLDNPEIRYNMGIEAYHTILNLWNSSVATERLFVIMRNFFENGGKLHTYPVGPCSCV